jgi:hypothetical protein
MTNMSVHESFEGRNAGFLNLAPFSPARLLLHSPELSLDRGTAGPCYLERLFHVAACTFLVATVRLWACQKYTTQGSGRRLREGELEDEWVGRRGSCAARDGCGTYGRVAVYFLGTYTRPAFRSFVLTPVLQNIVETAALSILFSTTLDTLFV